MVCTLLLVINHSLIFFQYSITHVLLSMIRREVHLYNLHPFDDCYIAQTLEDMYISKALGELDLFDEASL